MKSHLGKIGFCLIMVILLTALNSREGWGKAEYRVIAATNGAIGSEEHQAVKEFGRRLEELSKGRIKVDAFGVELGDAMSQIEHVMDGTQQVYFGELTWLANVHKDLNISAMAFAFRNVQHLLQFLQSDRGNQIWKELLQKNGIRVLDFSGQRLPRVVMCKRLLRSIDDFQGLKMRVPEIPIYMRVWDYIGTSTHRVTWGEIYLALAGGLIEAHEGPIDGIWAIRTYEKAPYMLRTDHIYSLYFVAVNDKYFQKLPKDLQEAVITAAKDANRFVNGLIDEAKILDKYKAQKCNVVYNEPMREQLRNKLATLGPKLEAEGFWSKGLYEYVSKLAK